MSQTDPVLNANRAPGMHLLQNPGPELSGTDDDDRRRTNNEIREVPTQQALRAKMFDPKRMILNKWNAPDVGTSLVLVMC